MPAPQDWRVLSSDALWADRLLDAGGRTLLLDLAWQVDRPVRLQVTRTRTAVDTEGEASFTEIDRLAGALDRLLELVDEVRFLEEADAPVGMTVVATGFDAAQGRCLFCGTSLDDVIAHCAACRTPHHAECWTESGGCTMFGCGCVETR